MEHLPYHCVCGKVYNQDNVVDAQKSLPKPPKYNKSLPCINRGEYIGKTDCNCASSKIYRCNLHKTCTLKPVLSKLSPNAVCSKCEDYQSFPNSSVMVITCHWNPLKFKRLRETYLEWRPTIKFPLQCIELVIDNEEPELPDSIVIRGDKENILWQKERMLNILIEDLPPEVKYVAWVDHDCVFKDKQWLEKSIQKLDSGIDLLQPWSKVEYLNLNKKIISTKPSATYTLKQGKYPNTGPGLAWVAKREFLDKIGGLYDRNIVGGADAVFFYSITNQRTEFLKRQSQKVVENCEKWKSSIDFEVKWDYIEGTVQHLYHGDNKNRQYVSRDEIIKDYDFDPNKHIEIGENRLLRFTKEVDQNFKDKIIEYFLNRKDDGCV